MKTTQVRLNRFLFFGIILIPEFWLLTSFILLMCASQAHGCGRSPP
jgi:hypothetical protein